MATKIGPIARPKRRDHRPRPAQDPLAARSCAACCATSPRAATLGDTTTLADPTRGRRRSAPSAAEAPGSGRVTDIWVPDNWRWRAGPVRAGPGCRRSTWTACSPTPSRRQHYLERPVRDWEAFFEACGDDDLIDEVARLLEVLDPDLRVAPAHRPPAAGPATRPLAWLAALRAPLGPARHARLGRLRLVPELQAAARWGSSASYGFELRLAFEDDRRNVDMFHAEGVPCVYIHSGYYD